MNYLAIALLCITSVPVFAKKFIQFLEEPSDIIVERNKPSVLHCNITAINALYISWLKDGVQLDLTNNTRITIQPAGSLHFNPVLRKKNLISDAGVYECVGETVVHGHLFKIVSQKARLSIVGMSKSFAVSPKDVTVNEGETAMFQCQVKRSHPDAKITWTKEGKNTDLTMNFRFVVYPSGTLEILSVLRSDEGNYICTANNDVMGKSLTAKAALTINQASTIPKPIKFLLKPSDVTVLKNQEAVLECIVFGYPKPIVEWHKDGVNIAQSSTGNYSKFGANSLKISSAQTTDAGKYECVMGNEKAGAALNVIDPPKFLVVPTDVESKEDLDITFSCNVSGFPTPKITWFLNNDIINGNEDFEHIDVKDGSIEIMDALESDSGIYQCVAKNNGGEIKAFAQFNVKRPPPSTPSTTRPRTTLATTLLVTTKKRIFSPGPPQNVTAVAINSTSIRLSWEKPAQPYGAIKQYLIFTRKFTQGKFNHNSQHTVKDMFLVITGLEPDTLYQFIVIAKNEHDKNGELSSPLDVYTRKKIVRELTSAPRRVRVEAISSKALRVSWRAPLNFSEKINNYSIRYRSVRGNHAWRLETSARLDLVLLKLEPYTKYAVTVTAHTDSGLGKKSDEVFGITKSGVPKGPPVHVQLTLTKNLLIGFWNPPVNPNGNITHYFVQLKNSRSGHVANYTVRRKSKAFKNFEQSVTYSLRVAACTEAGQGEFSSWIMKDTPRIPITEDEPPGKPTNLRVFVLLGMVKVTWEPPKEYYTVVRHYVLSWGKRTPNEDKVELPANQTWHLLRNLQPATIYIIRVIAFNKNGPGLEVMEKVIIPPDSQIVNSSVEQLRALEIGNRTMRISWMDSSFYIRPNVGYHVKFEQENEWRSFNVSGRMSLVVKDLKPGRSYTFYVKKNDEKIYNTVSNVTSEEVPSPPKDLTITMSSDVSSVNIGWNIPDESNGKLIYYKICWRPVVDDRQYKWICKRKRAHSLSYRISNLNTSFTYTVRILAINSAGEGAFSKSIKFHGDTSKRFTSFSTTVPPDRTKKIEASNKGALSESEMTLWIVIGVIAAITIAAIVVISVVLCKKKSHSSPSFKRKHGAESYKAVANGNSHSKKRSNKEDYWIKQDQLELEPCVKSDETVSSTIPRNADEMKPLDTPLQSRKDQSILEQENEKNTEIKEKSPNSFLESPPYRHGEDYQPLPVVDPQDNMTIRMSPFTSEKRSSFPPPPESLNGNDEPSSDYGSEEIVSPKCNEPSVNYLPEGKANGDVSLS